MMAENVIQSVVSLLWNIAYRFNQRLVAIREMECRTSIPAWLSLREGNPFLLGLLPDSKSQIPGEVSRAASSVGNPGSEVHHLSPFADSTMAHQCLTCLAMAMIGAPEPGQMYLKLSRHSVRNLEENLRVNSVFTYDLSTQDHNLIRAG
jgi:hypothetical protein